MLLFWHRLNLQSCYAAMFCQGIVRTIYTLMLLICVYCIIYLKTSLMWTVPLNLEKSRDNPRKLGTTLKSQESPTFGGIQGTWISLAVFLTFQGYAKLFAVIRNLLCLVPTFQCNFQLIRVALICMFAGTVHIKLCCELLNQLHFRCSIEALKFF